MRLWEKKKGTKWGIKILFRKGSVLKEFLPHEWGKLDASEIQELVVNWLGFADDVLFVSHSLDDVIESFKLFEEICASVGLEINHGKCGIMEMIWT